MAKTKKIKDGELEVTETLPTTVSTMSRNDVVGKIAEVQTKIDHLAIDLIAAETEKDEWVGDLAALDA